MRADILHAMNRITDTMWPGVAVLPFMSTGATDGRSCGGRDSDVWGAGVFTTGTITARMAGMSG